MNHLLEILNAPWAIEPARLQQLQEIYAAHLRGEVADIPAIEARIGKKLENPRQAYEVIDGVAVVPLMGVLAKRANLMMQISGGASYELFARDIRAAAADKDVVATIVLADTPGGAVDGVQLAAAAMREHAGIKPIATLADGTIASAGIWVGSAAGAGNLYIASDTTTAGSIGVVARHVDISGAEAAKGIKTTEITAGKYKRIAGQYGPLSEEGRAQIQASVDYLYSLFVDAVAAHRGTTAEDVLARMADGRTFIGRQAVDAGLVDGIKTRDELIAQLRDQAAAKARRPSSPPPKGIQSMTTKEQVAAEHPAIAEAFRAEGREAGARAERERIQAVEEQALPGHEALITSLKFDGKTSGPEAAAAVLQAERKVRTDRLQGMRADAPNVLPSDPAPADPAATGADPKPNQQDATAIAAVARRLVNDADARGERLSFADAVAQAMKEPAHG